MFFGIFIQLLCRNVPFGYGHIFTYTLTKTEIIHSYYLERVLYIWFIISGNEFGQTNKQSKNVIV